MKTIESTHPLCGVCGRPIAFLILGGEVITADGAAVVQGATVVLQRHSCRVPVAAAAPPTADRRVGRGRGPLPVTVTQAMECARNYLGSGEKSLQTTVNHLMSFGFRETTSRRALRLLDLERSEAQGFVTVRLPDPQNEPL